MNHEHEVISRERFSELLGSGSLHLVSAALNCSYRNHDVVIYKYFQNYIFYIEDIGLGLLVDGESYRSIAGEVSRGKEFDEVVKSYFRRDSKSQPHSDRPVGPPEEMHIIDGIFTFKEDFPEHVDRLAESLADTLSISRDLLDGTLSSLNLVDKAVQGRHAEIDKNLFERLIAYIGRFMISSYCGQWFINKNELHGLYEPFVKVRGLYFPLHYFVYNRYINKNNIDMNLPRDIDASISFLAVPSPPNDVSQPDPLEKTSRVQPPTSER